MIALIFDTETTGIPKHPRAKDGVQPHIIEWGGILVDVASGKELESLDRLCNPGEKLDAKITQITGLTDDDLAQEPQFAELLSAIRPMFADADVLVAHNLPFDHYLMELELARANVVDWPWPARNICTVQEHAEEWGKRPRLVDLYEHYTGAALDQKHRAIDDCRALLEVCLRSGVLR